MNPMASNATRSLSLLSLTSLISFVILLTSAGFAQIPQTDSSADQVRIFNGRVFLPESLDDSNEVEVFYRRGGYSQFENDWKENFEPAIIDEEGYFTIEIEQLYEDSEIEVVSPGTRRARFPVDEYHFTDENKIHVFRLDEGETATLQLTNSESGEPIENVIVGPLAPDTSATPDIMEYSYPFMVESNEDGLVELKGLIPGARYDVPLFAEGYFRDKINIGAGEAQQVLLTPGGQSISGVLMGHRTQKEYADTGVLLTGGPESFHILRKSDEEGTFTFTGLPPGDYQLSPYISDMGIMPQSSFKLEAEKDLKGIIIQVPEGILVSGQVVEKESGLALPDIQLQLENDYTNTDGLGRFTFSEVTGPWPKRVSVISDEYYSLHESGAYENALINGTDMQDITNVVLPLLKKRYLVISGEPQENSEEEDKASSIFELYSPTPMGGYDRERIRLSSASETIDLRGAGTRLGFARYQTELTTPLYQISTAREDTTTTLNLEYHQPAGIEGSLSYITEPDEPVSAPEFDARLIVYLNGKEFVWQTLNPDQEGRFQHYSLPSGQTLLEIVRPDKSVIISQQINLIPGETYSFSQQVPRGNAFAGKVINEDGAGIPEITLSVYGTDSMGDPLNTRVTTDRQGAFKVEGLGGDLVKEIRWEHFEYKPGSVNDIPLPDESYELTLEKREGIEVTLEAASYQLEDASIYLLTGSERIEGIFPSHWYYDLEDTIPAAGEAVHIIQPRKPGVYRLASRIGPSWAISPSFRWSGGTEKKEITLSPGQTASLKVNVEGLTEEQLKESEISLIYTTLPDSMQEGQEQEPRIQGSAFNYRDLLPGDYLLIVSTLSGEYKAEANIDLSAGEREQLSISFSGDLGGIQGQVVLDSDPPEYVSNAKVTLYPAHRAEPEPIEETSTDAEGRFSFDLVDTAKTYYLRVEKGKLTGDRTVVGSPQEATLNADILIRQKVKVVLVRTQTSAEQTTTLPYILLSRDGGQSVVIPAQDVGKPVDAYPGTYSLQEGEKNLGQVVIPKSNNTVRIEIPASE